MRLAWFFTYVDLRIREDCWDLEVALQAEVARGHFRPTEEWVTPAGEAFSPGNYYYVGGNSKLYGDPDTLHCHDTLLR